MTAALRRGAALALVLALAPGARSQGAGAGEARIDGRGERQATVGMRARLEDVVLPGPELRARAVDPDAEVVLRVTAVRAHGTAHRYDLEYYGLEPGRFDLAAYLERTDGSLPEGLPAISVEIRPLLPPGQIEPHPLVPFATPAVGGYRVWLIAGGVAWVVGLVAIVLLGRRRRRLEAARAEVVVTLADRLRPLVEAARAGELDEGRKAELERLLLAYWRRRLGLGEEKASRAMAALRGHAQAGPLLLQLEEWLHRPGPGDDVDVSALLAPYRDAPADFDRVGGPAGREAG